MYILHKHMKLKTLVNSLALQQIKELVVVTKQEGITFALKNECTCKTQWYIILILSINFGFSALCHSEITKTETV